MRRTPTTGDPGDADTPVSWPEGGPSAFLEEPILAWIDGGPTPGMPPPSLPPGSVVGPYVVLGVVGRGGSAIVYRARRQSEGGADLALKVFARAVSEFAGGFERERGLASRVDHPHIVPITDAGRTEDGSGYVAMPLIDGVHLDAYCRSAMPSDQAIAELFLQVCEAVGHLHGLGIIHRDLKPGNILVTAEGRPHVTDLGVARRDAPDAPGTASGVLMGTPGYFAPEQLDPDVGPIGPATDVHGLGATLYAALTGRPPFGARHSLSAFVDVLCLSPASPRSLNAAVSRGLDAICLRCLEKRPADRYRSTAELAEDLRRLRDGEPVRAVRGRSTRRAARWLRRHRAVLVGGLAMVALAAWIGVELLRQNRESRQEAAANLVLAQAAIEESFLKLPQELSTTPQTLRAQRALLQRGRDAYLALLQRSPGDVTLRGRYGTSEHLLGLAHDGLKDHEAALAARQASLATFEGLAREFPNDPLWRFKCFHAQLAIHNSYNALGEAGAADRSVAEAARLIEGLIEDEPDDPTYLDALAATAALQARRARWYGHLDAAEVHALRGRDAALRLVPHASEGNASYLRHQGTSAAELALIYHDRGDRRKALECSAEAIAGFERLVELAPGVLDFEFDLFNARLDRVQILIAEGDRPTASRELLAFKRRVDVMAEAHRDRPRLAALAERADGLSARLSAGSPTGAFPSDSPTVPGRLGVE